MCFLHSLSTDFRVLVRWIYQSDMAAIAHHSEEEYEPLVDYLAPCRFLMLTSLQRVGELILAMDTRTQANS